MADMKKKEKTGKYKKLSYLEIQNSFFGKIKRIFQDFCLVKYIKIEETGFKNRRHI